MKYLVFPGYVTSQNDGQSHYVSATDLMQLYGVDPKKCRINPPRITNLGARLIELRPRADGKYSLSKAADEHPAR